MMQNYDRTMELVNAANNSAGASQKQFEKTQDSLEAKINKLKNAWQEFAMGIANNQLIKGGISLLTNIITVINKLTGSLGDAGSAFARLGLIIGTIKLGRAFTPKAFSWIKGFFTAEGAKAGTEFTKGFDSTSTTLGAKIKNAFSAIKTDFFGKGAASNIAAYDTALKGLNVTTAGVKEQLITLGTTMGLTSAQMTTAVTYTNAGMTADTAAMAAKAGLTQVEIDEAIASVGAADANSAEANAAIKSAAAAKLEDLAKKGLLTTEKLGLATKLKYVAQLLFGNSATRLQAALTLKLGSVEAAEALMKEKQTAAQWKLNSAMQAFPIGWIIAGIAALVGVIALADAFTESAAEETKSWEKTLEGASEAANEAKDAYNGIFDSKNEYEETQSALENLVEGTEAWRQALFEANQQVLELLTNYPMLATYITSTNGRLMIAEAGWTELIDLLQWQSNNATAMQLGNQRWIDANNKANARDDFKSENLSSMDMRYYQGNIDYAEIGDDLLSRLESLYVTNPEAFVAKEMDAKAFSDFLSTLEIENIDGTYLHEIYGKAFENFMADSGFDGITTDGNSYYGRTKESILEDINTGEIDLYSFDEEIVQLAQEFGLTAIELVNMRDELGPFVTQQRQLQEQISSTLQGMINLDEDNINSEYASSVTDFISDAAAKNYQQTLEDTSDQLYKFNFGAEQAIIDLANELITTGQDLTGVITDTTGSKKTYQQVYQVLTGQVAQEDWGKNELANQIAAAYNNMERSESANKMIDRMEQLASTDKQTAKMVNAVLSGSSTDLSLSELEKLQTMNLSPEAMAEMLGFTGYVETDKDGNQIFITAAQELAEVMGYGTEGVDELSNQLQENINMINKQIVDSRKQRLAYSDKYGRQKDTSLQSQAENEFERESQYGQSYIDALENTMTNLEQFGDKQLMEVGYQAVIDITDIHGQEGLNEVNELINSMNWSNPIQSAAQLRREVEHGTESTKRYASALLEAGESAFGASAQFQYLYRSEEFGNLKESISDTIDEFGELSGTDIYDLVDDCESLQQIMENTGISAEGLAEALTQLEIGKITLNQLTDTVLASLKGFDGLSDVIHKTLSEIENFDPGLDENDVSDFMTTAYETVSDNLNKGAVGNSQNKKYLDYLFGPDWRQAVDKESGELVELTGDAYVEAMEHYVGLMEKNQGDMRASFIDLINGVNSAGEELTWNEETQNYKELGNLTVSYDDNGGIVLDGYQGMTTDEVVSQLASAYDVTEQYARMMLTDFSNYSSELMAELNKNDYSAGIEAAYDSLDTSRVRTGTSEHGAARYTERKAIDESEIQAISELYGKEYDEVKSDFINKGALITDLYDEEGIFKQGEELQAELQRISDSSKDPLLNYENDHWLMNLASVSYKNIEDGAGKIREEMTGIKVDYNELLNYLAEQGVPQDQLHQAAQESLASLQESVGDTPVMVEVELENGETETIEITPEMKEELSNGKGDEEE